MTGRERAAVNCSTYGERTGAKNCPKSLPEFPVVAGEAK
jgi:hypothetical protein